MPKNCNNYIFDQTNIHGLFDCGNHKIKLIDTSGWTMEKNKDIKTLFELYLTSDNEEKILDDEEKKSEDYKLAVLLKNTKKLLMVPEKVSEFRNEKYESFNFPKKWDEQKVPTTLGSMTNDLLFNFLYFQMSKNEHNEFDTQIYQDFLLANYSIGTVMHSNSKKELQNKGNKNIIKENINYHRKDFNFRSSAIEGGSIKTLEKRNDTSGYINSILFGGRTINEKPERFEFEHVADIDFQSCYGNTLKDLVYPIGLPNVISFTKDEKDQNEITLKQFLEIYKHELVKNMWQVYISGPLNFYQTLLFSKNIVSKTTAKNDFEEQFKKENEFILLSNELKNSLITFTSLEVLKKICTNEELKQIVKL